MRIVRRAGMWRWMLIGLVVLGLAAGAEVRADGKVFPPVALAQEVAMPDQRALLAWKDGVETLVIESAFVGEGNDFAWVVPLPAKPEVEAATRGTLASASALMLPVVRPAWQEAWLFIVLAALVVATAAAGGWRATGWGLRVAVVAGAGAVVGAILEAFLGLGLLFPLAGMAVSCWWGRDVIKKEASLLAHLIVVLVASLLFALSIPSFGKVRGGAEGDLSGPAGVTLEQRVVGDFDVTLISGREGESVVRWLVDNRFALSEAARVEAERHAAGGGWFVASRVRRDFAERGRSVPAPLVFRFPSEKPVYPMRFTGAGANAALEVELFVFGPARTKAKGLRTVAWGPIEFREPKERTRYLRGTGQPQDSRVVTHPQLRRLAAGTDAVTWLRGTLSPAEMQADLVLQWDKAAKKAEGLVAYSREAVYQSAAVAGLGVALLAMIVLGFLHGGQRPPWRRSIPWLAAGAVVAGWIVFTLPSVALREGKAAIPWHAARQIDVLALMALWDMNPQEADDARVKARFAAELKKFVEPNGWKISVGDGPGQVEIARQASGKWRVLHYDAAGQARYATEEEIVPGEGYSSDTKKTP